MFRRCLAPNLRRQLNELPQTLDETYERVLREIYSTNERDALRLLQCLTVAKRPLLVEELAEILAYDLDGADGEIPTFHEEWRWEDQEQAVLSACSSLISIVDSGDSRVVQFSHFSVKEFLTSKRLAKRPAVVGGEDVSRYHILPETAHTTLTRACLGVLLRLDYRVDKERAKKIPLAEYAAEHWVSHAQVENVKSRVSQAMETLFDSEKPYFSAWLRIYCVDPQRRSMPRHDGRFGFTENHRWPVHKGWMLYQPAPATPLYYAARYGFHDLVEQLAIKKPWHVNAIGGDLYSPLLAALLKKDLGVAEFLVEHGANVDAQGPENQTALHKVMEWSDDSAFDVTKFLLKHGADVNARRHDLYTPLHLATVKGRFKVARLLLVHKANVDCRSGQGSVPLHLVSFVDNSPDLGPRLARLLLEYKADVNAKNEDHATPLHYASFHHLQEVAQILLDHGAKVNATNNLGETPLHKVSLPSTGPSYRWGNRFSVTQLLLERGADANAQDHSNTTPLHWASKVGNLEVTRALLDHGANVNAENDEGETPLQILAKFSWDGNGSPRVAELLLERGANANAQDHDNTTPLHQTSEWGKLEVTRVLLDHGAKVNAENNRGETPLHLLSRRESGVGDLSPRVAQLLLERGADVNARDKDHVTPIHRSFSSRSPDIARVLFDYGADVNEKNDQGQSPLFLAIEASHSSTGGDSFIDLIGSLVEHGADANTQGKNNTTALHLASKYGRPSVVRVLLNHGANISAKNDQGQTLIHQLAGADNWIGSDSLAVAQLLLENNLDVNAQDKDHNTPLHLACEHKSVNIVRVLTDHGAIVDMVNMQGQTPLHVLAKHIFAFGSPPLEDIVRILLERGANVNTRDKDNATPLHLVFSTHESSIAPILLDGGANASAKDNRGQTPLHRLVSNGFYSEVSCLSFVQALLKHGADVNAEDNNHATALHLAFDFYKLFVAPVLLDHGANPNAKDNLGKTPLHRLLECFHLRANRGVTPLVTPLDTIQLLLEHGAKPNAQTPLQLSSLNGMAEVTRLLSKYSAKDAMENDQDQTPLHTTHVSSKKIPVLRS